jgi:serine phosphatase RsbU (regulator of sigma subunit)
MASEIQQALLPQQLPRFPRHSSESALNFCSKYLPTRAVGGDFFHILPLSDTKAGVFICDVMGHGVRAAFVTAIQRALIEELVGVADQPGKFLSQINRALLSILRRTRTPMFASAFYLCVDVTTGEMRHANAGHPKPLHVRRMANVVDVLSAENGRPGPALGVFPESTFKTFTTQLDPGDFILLFTDGLLEVEGPSGELYDPERLVAVVRNGLQLPPEKLLEEILADAQKFSADAGFIDDVCIVGMDFKAIAGTPKKSGSLATAAGA